MEVALKKEHNLEFSWIPKKGQLNDSNTFKYICKQIKVSDSTFVKQNVEK